MPNLQATRSAIGVAVRRHDAAAEAAARRAHVAAVLEQQIREALATAPPLLPAQADHLTALLYRAEP